MPCKSTLTPSSARRDPPHPHTSTTMSDGDILTPFIENYRDVFITYILPRINEPAQACACGVPNAIPHFMANLVLPQVSRTFRRLIPGYKETYEAHVGEFERRKGEWVVFKRNYLHMLLLNTSPSIRRWLLDDARVDSDENRSALDRYIQSGKQEDMPRWYRCECEKKNADCAGKCCIGCAVFCANAEHTGYRHTVFGQSIRGACPACAPSIMTKCICCNNLCCNMCMSHALTSARVPQLPGSTQPSCRECYKNLCEWCSRSAPCTWACGHCRRYHFEFCPEAEYAVTCEGCKHSYCGNCAYMVCSDFIDDKFTCKECARKIRESSRSAKRARIS